MTSNPEPIGQQVQQDFQNLLADVTGPECPSQTAYTVEMTLFRRLLALGAALLRRFLLTRAAVRPAEPITAPDGTRLTYHDQRPTTYDSVFGKVRFWRHAFTAPGQESLCPLDAELSLPARCSADLLREWAAYGTTNASYRESQTVLARILGVSLSVQALDSCVTAAGADVTTFDEQPADPTTPVPSGTILVVQADGKGVPLAQPPTPPCAWAAGRGRSGARQRKPSSPASTPSRRIGARRRRSWGPCRRSLLAWSPRPAGKELRATLEGKGVAMRRLVPRVAQRAGPHLQQRVALTDGAEALQQQLVPHWPESTLILDIIHATAYLWDTANALLGRPIRSAWRGSARTWSRCWQDRPTPSARRWRLR